MKWVLIYSFILGFNLCGFTQILISPPAFSYTETFGSSGPASWTNNSSYTGWYHTSTSNAYGGYINITATAPANAGGLYTYQCASGGNVKLGARPSGGTNSIYFGLRLRNNTGFTVNSISVSFDYFQFSLAENGNVIKTMSFSYLQGATVTNLTAGGFVNVPALNFSQLQNSSVAGSSQLVGYPCTQTGSVSSTCINVNIPVNEEILLRWEYPNTGNNEHHLGIDNVVVSFYTNNTVNPNTACSTLPISLSNFNGYSQNSKIILNWQTLSELNNNYFSIEHSTDGNYYETIGKVNGAGNSITKKSYQFIHDLPTTNINYYRLKQTDFNGTYSYSKIISVNTSANFDFNVSPNPSVDGLFVLKTTHFENTDNLIEVLDFSGNLLHKQILFSSSTLLNLSKLNKGFYLIRLSRNGNLITKKLLIN